MHIKFFFGFFSALVWCFFIIPTSVLAHETQVNLQTLKGNQQSSSVQIDLKNAAGGLSLAVADLGNDGIAEIIVGNGVGNAPLVRILRQDGSEIGSFLAYAADMGLGINVVVCDLDGDNKKEIITAPQRGGGPHVRIFDSMGNTIDQGGFMAYEQNFTGGVNLTCGDLDGDNRAELVTLPSIDGGPHIKIWKFENQKINLHQEFFSAHYTDTRGLVGAIKNKKLFLATQKGNDVTLRSYVIHSFPTLEKEERKTFSTAGITSIFSHQNKILLTTAEGKVVDWETKEEIFSEQHGLIGVSADLNQDGISEIVLTEARPIFGEDEGDKSIVIDVSEQRLYSYERGILANTFAVSTGKYPWRTPVGKHAILAKIYQVHYAWNYGANDERNYDLGVVPFNLRFFPHIYIHYAPWHNNFGHPMSHGCVNVSYTDAQWIYEWSEEGIPVTVQE
ncbi:L,D-transpeptidase [Patescibacteria group bacterium]